MGALVAQWVKPLLDLIMPYPRAMVSGQLMDLLSSLLIPLEGKSTWVPALHVEDSYGPNVHGSCLPSLRHSLCLSNIFFKK